MDSKSFQINVVRVPLFGSKCSVRFICEGLTIGEQEVPNPEFKDKLTMHEIDNAWHTLVKSKTYSTNKVSKPLISALKIQSDEYSTKLDFKDLTWRFITINDFSTYPYVLYI